MTTLRRATIADAVHVAPRLREADKQECMATLGLPPEVALPLSFENDNDSWAMVNDAGEPFGLFGVDPIDQHDYFGLIWMVSTPELFSNRKELIRLSPLMIDALHKDHELLGNHVDKRNVSHIRYLKWLGFKMLREIPEHGVEKRPFIEFIKLRNSSCA